MYTFSKHLKNKPVYNYSKEYNIVAIISMILAITATLSFAMGAILVYSYLSKLDKITIFMQVIEDKLLYATSFVSFFILLIIAVCSCIPSILLIINKNNKAIKDNSINPLNILKINVSFFIISLSLSMYKFCDKKDWILYLYAIYILSFLIIICYIGDILNFFKNEIKNSKDIYESAERILNLLFSLSSSIIAPCLVLLFGKETFEYTSSSNQDYLFYFFIFWVIPLLASFLVNWLIISWKTQMIQEKITIFCLAVLLWSFPIYNMSPFVMNILGVNESKIKTFNINNEKKEGRILLNYGEKWIFLETEKKYHDSIILEKNEIKIIED